MSKVVKRSFHLGIHLGRGLACCLAAAVGLTACGGGGGGTTLDVDAAPGTPDALVCEPPPSDSDADGIADRDEGPSIRDTDTDGTPDTADLDSDGDGVMDALEAGDDNLCSEPRDTDGDGNPDFRSMDADANGVPDGDEPMDDLDDDGYFAFQDEDDDGDLIGDLTEIGADLATPVDFDADGTPDYLDTDSDDDGVPDQYEGISDDDGDDLPAFHDDDADGDGISDTLEAGPDPATPLDSDGDGRHDFLDLDADNDGLPDDQEDVNRDGIRQPGESDPRDADTDGDGFPDVVEWAAGTDPTDEASVIPAGDFYFVLPYYGDEQRQNLAFSTDILKADVLFEVDTTSSMSGTISTLQDSLSAIVAEIALSVPNVAMGAAGFEQFPVSGFGSAADLPFYLTARITTVVADVQAGLDALVANGGADGMISGYEAIYQAVTGEGVAWPAGTRPAGAVPKFEPFVGYDATKGHGVLGGAGFREGALPILVLATDTTSNEAEGADGYWMNGIPAAHNKTQAIAAARAVGARFVVINSDAEGRDQLREIATATGAVVPPEAWGAAETMCHTGLAGALEAPGADGLCPLVFTMASNGTGVNTAVVDAIKALVSFGEIDISALAVGDPTALPQVDTATFITSMTPIPPAPPGVTIDGDVFRNVRPGTPVDFRVRARNTTVESRREAQLFRVVVRVRGDVVTTLDERNVYVIVPGGGSDL